MTPERFIRFQKQLERVQRAAAETAGELRELSKSLAKFKCDGLKAAKRMRRRLESEVADDESKLELRIKKHETEYPDA